jgi:hypothetical protein
MLPLYLTIWCALALFVVGETGRSLARRGSPAPAWAWWAFTLGLVLALVHTLLAFDIVHNWVHDGAVEATARQTQEVFGIRVGWGVYVNYVFLAVWLADAWWWRVSPDLHRRPAAVTWVLRGFSLLIIFNGAVVFAAGWRSILGLLVVSWLVRVWSLRAPASLAAPGEAGVRAAPNFHRGSGIACPFGVVRLQQISSDEGHFEIVPEGNPQAKIGREIGC